MQIFWNNIFFVPNNSTTRVRNYSKILTDFRTVSESEKLPKDWRNRKPPKALTETHCNRDDNNKVKRVIV